jgi:hypothetical protein
MARLRLGLFGTPRDELEAAGVWVIARLHAPLDEAGNVRWSHGLLP